MQVGNKGGRCLFTRCHLSTPCQVEMPDLDNATCPGYLLIVDTTVDYSKEVPISFHR